jgi:hypothetical protein
METPEERQDQEQADQTAIGGVGGDDRRETEHDGPDTRRRTRVARETRARARRRATSR